MACSVRRALGAGEDCELSDLSADFTKKWADMESKNKHLEIKVKV